MSSSLRIPQNRREGIAAIARLKSEEVEELSQHIAKIPAKLFIRKSISKEIKSAKFEIISDQNAVLVVETILTLLPPLLESGKSVHSFLADLLDAVDDEILSKVLVINDDERKNLAKNLLELLTIPSIGLAVKATGVLYENERSLSSSRVLSEVRPIFGMEDTIGGAIIIHTLRLEYFEKGDARNCFFVHLDDSDIEDLILKLGRAKNKSTKIKEMLKASSTPLIEEESK